MQQYLFEIIQKPILSLTLQQSSFPFVPAGAHWYLYTFVSISLKLFWTCSIVRTWFKIWSELLCTKSLRHQNSGGTKADGGNGINAWTWDCERPGATKNTGENIFWSYLFERNGMYPEFTVLCLLLSLLERKMKEFIFKITLSRTIVGPWTM